jgi:hypothetical protein
MTPDYADIPVEGLRTIATDIERAVVDGVREPSLTSQDGIVVNSEAIQQAIRTRAARSELITAFRDTGHVAEMRNGLIDIIGSREYEKSTRRGDRARNALLIMSENDDRWILYESILNDNNFPPRSLGAVQRTFYEARITVLSNGQRYEDESGELVYVGGAPPPPPPAEDEEE